MAYYLVRNEDELYHHGIKGMKWGRRRWQTKDGSLTAAGRKRYSDVDEKKAAMKAAKKEYNKSFNKAYNRAIGAYSPIKKHREANDRRWEDATNKAEAYNKAKKDYKDAKKQEKANRTPEEKAARRKKALKVGATIAATALAAYGAKKLYDMNKSSKEQMRIAKGAAAAEKARKAMEKEIAWKNEMMKDAFANGATSFKYQLNYPELGVNSTKTFVNPKLRR